MSDLRFRTIRKFLGPRWLTDDDADDGTQGEGKLLGYALDIVKDAFVERVFQGLIARFPLTAPPDAFPPMGRDRRVFRGLNESLESFQSRCLVWLQDRKTAGNPFTLMQKLAEYTGAGPAFRTVDARGNWYSRAADGTRSLLLKQANWNWFGESVGKRWSRFWVIIYPNGLWTPGPQIWGDPATQAWGDPGHTWGSTATPDEVASVKFIVNDWKPGGTRCVNIILAFDSASFDPASPEPDGLWGRWSKNVGGVMVPSRLATARYWDGA